MVILSTLAGSPGLSRSKYVPACDHSYGNTILGRSECVYARRALYDAVREISAIEDEELSYTDHILISY